MNNNVSLTNYNETTGFATFRGHNGGRLHSARVSREECEAYASMLARLGSQDHRASWVWADLKAGKKVSF